MVWGQAGFFSDPPLARNSRFALATRSPRFRLCSPEIRKKLCLFCRLTFVRQTQPGNSALAELQKRFPQPTETPSLEDTEDLLINNNNNSTSRLYQIVQNVRRSAGWPAPTFPSTTNIICKNTEKLWEPRWHLRTPIYSWVNLSNRPLSQLFAQAVHLVEVHRWYLHDLDTWRGASKNFHKLPEFYSP